MRFFDTSGSPKASLSLRTLSLAASRLSISAPPVLRSEVEVTRRAAGDGAVERDRGPPRRCRARCRSPCPRARRGRPPGPRSRSRTRSAKVLDISMITSIFLSPRSGEKEIDDHPAHLQAAQPAPASRASGPPRSRRTRGSGPAVRRAGSPCRSGGPRSRRGPAPGRRRGRPGRSSRRSRWVAVSRRCHGFSPASASPLRASRKARTSLTVLAFISATVPTCTMRWLASMAMRSDTEKALCMSWVTTIEVQRSLARMPRDELVDDAGADRVQPGGGLVPEDDLGLGGDGTGQPHPPAHAAGEVRGAHRLDARQVDQREHPRHAPGSLLRRHLGEVLAQGVLDVLAHRDAVEQRRRLEHHRHPPADGEELLLAEAGEVLPVEDDRARRRGPSAR